MKEVKHSARQYLEVFKAYLPMDLNPLYSRHSRPIPVEYGRDNFLFASFPLVWQDSSIMRTATTFLLVVLTGAPGSGRAAGLEDLLLKPESFESMSTAEVLLVASGVSTRRELKRWSTSLHKAIQKVVKKVRKKKLEARDQAEALLEALHGGILKRYVADLNDLRETLRTGRYNCLTATALYLLAAQELGLVAKAYAMQGHVQALVFLPEGPRYLETTHPDSFPQQGWHKPLSVYSDTFQAAWKMAKPKMTELYKEVEKKQALGMDEEADQALAVVGQLRDACFQLAEERMQEYKKSAFEVDLPTLVSLFYWNRSVATLLKGHEKQALSDFTIALALGSKSWSSRAMGVRFFQLQSILIAHAGKHGWASTVQALSTMIRRNKNAREDLELRDLRAKIWIWWAVETTGEKRCRVVRAAAREDGQHPMVKILVVRARGWSCLVEIPTGKGGK